MHIVAVILAAGLSRRMGTPKQLLPWGETTLLGATIRQAQQARVSAVIVVSGHVAEQVEAIARAAGAHVCHNPDYASGEMLSSLQAAVASLPETADGVVVMLADQPWVSSAEIDPLIEAFEQGRGTLVAPTFNGQRGNPVLIGRVHFEELLALPRGGAPRDLLRTHPVHLVAVESDAILRDVDERETYDRSRPRSTPDESS